MTFAAVAALVSLLLLRGEGPEPPRAADGGRVRIAVLPFENLTGEPGREYFADGLTEEVIACLASSLGPKVAVIARTSAMRYKGTRKGVRTIGRELGVRYVLEGSVRQAAGRVRVTAQLIEASSQSHLWAESFERDQADSIELQAAIAARIASSLGAPLSVSRGSGPPPPGSAPAYEAYLQGRYFWNQRTTDAMRRAIDYFERALEQDPRFAPAHAGLADAYSLLASTDWSAFQPRDAMPKARAAALRALELDDSLAEAHTSLAWVHLTFDWDWPAAERRFRLALERNPSYVTARQWHAYGLLVLGRPQEAVAEIRRAWELDPFSPMVNLDLGAILLYAGQPEAAIGQIRRTLEMEPSFDLAYAYLGLALEELGRHAAAEEAFRRGLALTADSPVHVAALAHFYGRLGRRQSALDMLRRLEGLARQRLVTSFHMAIAHAGLGHTDEALLWLERAVAAREESVPYLHLERRFEPLRSDARFTALLDRLGLPPAASPRSRPPAAAVRATS